MKHPSQELLADSVSRILATSARRKRRSGGSLSPASRDEAEGMIELGEVWDVALVRRKIHGRVAIGNRPHWLLLGQRESEMLARHLADSFGKKEVSSLQGARYMGLEVVRVDLPRFCCLAGHRCLRRLKQSHELEVGGKRLQNDLATR